MLSVRAVPRSLGCRSVPHVWVFALVLSAQALAQAPPATSTAPTPSLERVVSLNPSLSAIVLALGAEEKLIGVDDYSARQQPALAELPRVGGLFSPSLEAVAALAPDVVLLVPSVEQRAFRKRLEELGIRVVVFENIRFDQVLDNIRELGVLLGREEAARERIEAIERALVEVSARVEELDSPPTVLVLQREPLYIVGRGSFLAHLLDRAGANNLGAEFADAYPRVGAEWLVASEPELLIDMTPDAGDTAAYWSRWPSLPAVRKERVLRLEPERVTLPGPWLDESLWLLARAIHPDRDVDPGTESAESTP